jgi:hypothetical protein
MTGSVGKKDIELQPDGLKNRLDGASSEVMD